MPWTFAVDEVGKRYDGEIVQREFAIGIHQDAGDFVEEFARTAGVRADEEAASVVIVGVEIVPDDWFSPEKRGDFANVRGFGGIE